MAERDRTNLKLRKIYYDPKEPGSYGGTNRLLAEAKKKGIPVNLEKVRTFFGDQHAYFMHKPVRITFPRNRTYVSGIDKQWQADLADMQALAKKN